VVGGAQLAQAADRRGERRRGGRVAVAGGQTGAGQVAFSPLHRGQVPGLAGVEEGEQFAGGGGVAQVEGGAGGQRPRPAQVFVADPKGARMSQGRAGVAQYVPWLVTGEGGEGLHDADPSVFLGIFALPQVR
jgi:hypothetical protein